MKKETIQLFKVFMSENAAPEVSKVLNSGYIGQGEKVNQFESYGDCNNKEGIKVYET